MTKNQKEFCRQYILCNNNPSEAYRKAYPSCKKEATAWTNSCRLLKNAKVIKYIKQLQEEAQKEFKINRGTQIKHLEEIRKKMMNEEGDYRIAIKAIEEQSKLLGLYEAGKIDLTSKGDKIENKSVSIIQIPDNGR